MTLQLKSPSRASLPNPHNLSHSLKCLFKSKNAQHSSQHIPHMILSYLSVHEGTFIPQTHRMHTLTNTTDTTHTTLTHHTTHTRFHSSNTRLWLEHCCWRPLLTDGLPEVSGYHAEAKLWLKKRMAMPS